MKGNYIASIMLKEYSEYQLKICFPNTFGLGAGTVVQNQDLAIITGLNAVALGKKTSGEFFESINPTGVILPYAGNLQFSGVLGGLVGFLPCDGRVLEEVEDDPENINNTFALRQLLLSSGSPYGSVSGSPRIPDMRGLVPMGASRFTTSSQEPNSVQDVSDLQQKRSSGTDANEPSVYNARAIGSVGGSQLLQAHDHRNPRLTGGGLGRLRANNEEATPGVDGDQAGADSGGEGSGEEDRPFLFSNSTISGLLTGGGANAVRGLNGSKEVSETRGVGNSNFGRFVEYHDEQEQVTPHLVCSYIIKL